MGEIPWKFESSRPHQPLAHGCIGKGKTASYPPPLKGLLAFHRDTCVVGGGNHGG